MKPHTADDLVFVGSAGAGNDDFELLEVIPIREGLVGSGAACWLKLSDPFVVAEHGRFIRQHDHWYLAAAGFASPVVIDGDRGVPGEGRLLKSGALIEFGDTRFLVGGFTRRQALPLDDEVALLMAADVLTEADDPLGERIVANSTELPAHCRPLVENGSLVVTWRHGLIQRLELRDASEHGVNSLRSVLTGLLGQAECLGLRELVVATETFENQSLENARFILHAVATALPPSLGSVELGVVDASASDFVSSFEPLCRVLPITTPLDSLFQRPRTPTIEILEADGWQATAGSRIKLTPDLTLATVAAQQPRPQDWKPPVRFHHRGPWVLTSDLHCRVNGRRNLEVGKRLRLRNNDELQIHGLRFRVEL